MSVPALRPGRSIDEPQTLESDLGEGVEALRRFTRAVDLAWHRARVLDAPLRMVMVLGEASHGLHRALIALAEISGPLPREDPFSR